MRLNCPNCATGYEVPDGMIPTGGRHVQCSDCHTRWFVPGTARPMLSEDEIISRLEVRSRSWPRPAPVPDPPPAAPEPAELAGAFVWENADEAAAEPAAPDPAVPAPKPPSRLFAVDADPPPRPLAANAGPPAAPVPPPRPFTPDAAPPPAAPRRPASRIDLSADQPREPAPPPAPRRGFARGLGAALGLFALALVAYLGGDAIAVRLPATAPALDAYADAVDGFRNGVAERLGGGDDGG